MTEYAAIPSEYYEVMGEKDFSNHYGFGSFMLSMLNAEMQKLKLQNYFPIPNAVFDLDLTDGEILVYAFLLRCEDRRTYQCHPSYATIGRAIGKSVNSVRKYVQGLIQKGLYRYAVFLDVLVHIVGWRCRFTNDAIEKLHKDSNRRVAQAKGMVDLGMLFEDAEEAE